MSTEITEDEQIRKLLKQVDERRTYLKEVNKDKSILKQKTEKMTALMAEYEREYQRILDERKWSRGTATKHGIKPLDAVVKQSMKATKTDPAPDGKSADVAATEAPSASTTEPQTGITSSPEPGTPAFTGRY